MLANIKLIIKEPVFMSDGWQKESNHLDKFYEMYRAKFIEKGSSKEMNIFELLIEKAEMFGKARDVLSTKEIEHLGDDIYAEKQQKMMAAL